MRGTRLRAALLVLTVPVTVTGCGPELSDVPLPAAVSGPTYTVDAVFAEALNLPVQAPVKMGGDVVGEVASVTAEDYRAQVRLRLRESVALPQGTRAGIRVTSAMGEAYVELLPPRQAGPPIEPGAVIGIEHTTASPDTTDLLSAMSVVVTGGSFADLEVVVSELNVALHGNTDEAKRLLHRLDRMVSGLNRRTGEVDRVLDRMDALSAALAEDSAEITAAVRELTPAIRVLAQQRESAMAMLREVTALSRTSRRVITATKDDIVRQLEQVQPILDSVIRHQAALAPTLAGVRDFGRNLDRATPGDYANFQLTALLDVHVNGLPLLDLEPGRLPRLDLPQWPAPPQPGPLSKEAAR